MKKMFGLLPIFISLNSFAVDYIENGIKNKEELKLIADSFISESGFHSSAVDKIVSTENPNIVLVKLNPKKINSDNLYLNYFINEKLFSIGNLLKKDEYNRFFDVNDKYVNQINLNYLKDYLNLDINKRKTFDYISDTEKTTVYVFTDTTCPYCYKYSKEIDKLNEMGVSVKNIPYSRSYSPSNEKKENGDSFFQLSNIICSENPKLFFDLYFQETIQRKETAVYDHYSIISDENKKECEKIIEEGYYFGKNLNVTGTPSTLFENGEVISGYLTSDKVINILKKSNLIE